MLRKHLSRQARQDSDEASTRRRRQAQTLDSSITAICQALEPSYAAPVVLLDGILGSWLTLNPTRARDGGISAARRSLSSAARQEFCSAEREDRGIESSSSDSSMCR